MSNKLISQIICVDMSILYSLCKLLVLNESKGVTSGFAIQSVSQGYVLCNLTC